MAITLGDLRTFCQEIATPDSSGSTADRENMLYINNAIRRVYSETGWDQIEKEQKLTILPEETGSALVVTQDSLGLTLGGAETFLAKYVTDEWDLLVPDDTHQTFRIVSIDDSPTNQAATMRAGDEWIEASGSGKTYYWIKTRYDLPDNAKKIRRVQELQGGYDLQFVLPQDFDYYRNSWGPQRGANPQFYTLREDKIEIWPHPGSTRVKIALTYRKGPPAAYTTASDDSEEIDWPEEWGDLLEKAIMVEAAIYQGEAAPVPYQLARTEYEERLKRYRGLDNDRAEWAGPIDLSIPTFRSRHRRSVSWRMGSDQT